MTVQVCFENDDEISLKPVIDMAAVTRSAVSPAMIDNPAGHVLIVDSIPPNPSVAELYDDVLDLAALERSTAQRASTSPRARVVSNGVSTYSYYPAFWVLMKHMLFGSLVQQSGMGAISVSNSNALVLPPVSNIRRSAVPLPIDGVIITVYVSLQGNYCGIVINLMC